MAENHEDYTGARRWAFGSQEAVKVLTRLKKEELQRIETSVALQHLGRAFESCRIHSKPEPDSGLVEQQRWFQMFRR